MAKRWLKVEVTRTLIADVYVLVDDEQVRLSEYKHSSRLLQGSEELRAVARKAGEETLEVPMNFGEWEDHGVDPSLIAEEVSEEEARQYRCWDAIKGEVIQEGT